MKLGSHSLGGHHGHRRLSLKAGSQDSSRGGGHSDEEEVEADQGNVLSHIISQLRPGADLSRVTLPTFVTEPRSMLERITNFMAHPDTLIPVTEVQDPVKRFVAVVRFYLSGWHIRPPGVKKPLNPILGETFSGYWEYSDGTKGYYISEQTSHHPPKSSYFFMAPEHNIRIDGTLKPRSKFLGNSAASLMEGIAILRLMNHGTSKGGEKYFLTQPNMYARGILFGKMKYELGDHINIRCPENHLVADIEFKVKGYFGGAYNAIGGTIKNEQTGEILYEISGSWDAEMDVKSLADGHKEVLFNAKGAKHSPPLVRPLEEQSEEESQKLWLKTCEAIRNTDHTAATDEKTKIEEAQREKAARRQQEGREWHPRYFRPVQGGPGGPEEGEENLDWILEAVIDGKTPKEMTEQILSVMPILPGQKNHAPQSERTRPPEAAISQQATPRQSTSNLIDNSGVAVPAPPSGIQQQSVAQHDQSQQNLTNQAPQTQPAENNMKLEAATERLSIRRHDTETDSVDEFVDAES